jgi:hypothetical protein
MIYRRIFSVLDGAIEALSGWTEMNNGRGNVKINLLK